MDLSEEIHLGQGGYRPFEAIKGRLDDGTLKFDVTRTHTHVGTHVESPLHYFETGKNVGDYSLAKFLGRAVLLRLSINNFHQDVSRFEITPALIESILGSINLEGAIFLVHVPVDLREFVVKTTDKGQKHPELTNEAARYLVDRGISMFGFDDCGFEGDGREIHDIFLTKDVLLIEFLRNLEKLHSTVFFLCIAPLRITGIDSGWVRAWAIDEAKYES